MSEDLKNKEPFAAESIEATEALLREFDNIIYDEAHRLCTNVGASVMELAAGNLTPDMQNLLKIEARWKIQ